MLAVADAVVKGLLPGPSCLAILTIPQTLQIQNHVHADRRTVSQTAELQVCRVVEVGLVSR